MGRRSYKKKTEKSRALAMQGVKDLIRQADEIHKKSSALADKYAGLAKRMILKHKLKVMPNIKRRICKGCNAFLVPGKTSRIRTHKGHVVIYCMKCKRITRVGYD